MSVHPWDDPNSEQRKKLGYLLFRLRTAHLTPQQTDELSTMRAEYDAHQQEKNKPVEPTLLQRIEREMLEEVSRGALEQKIRNAQAIVDKEFPLLAPTEKNREIIQKYLSWRDQDEYYPRWSEQVLADHFRGAILFNKDALQWLEPAPPPPPPAPKEQISDWQLPIDASVFEQKNATVEQLRDLVRRQHGIKK